MSSFLNDSIFKSLTVIFQSYQIFIIDEFLALQTNYSLKSFSFKFSQSVSKHVQDASSSAITFGIAVELKRMLAEPNKDAIDDTFPRLYNVTLYSFQRCIQNRVKLTKKI